MRSSRVARRSARLADHRPGERSPDVPADRIRALFSSTPAVLQVPVRAASTGLRQPAER
jgi:hypothetical protein